MIRSVVAAAIIATMGWLAAPAHAQVSLGAEAAYIAGGFGSLSDLGSEIEDRDLSGTFGLGGRLALSLPALPVDAYGAFTYYFPDCDSADCSYWTASLAATLPLPLPVLQPYLVGGWQFKSYDLSVEGFESSTENNPFLGLGIELDAGFGFFLEGAFEFEGGLDNLPGTSDELSVTPFVLKGGILLGG